MAISAADLATLRTKNQKSRLWAFVETGNIIFQHTLVEDDDFDVDEFSLDFIAGHDLSRLHPGMLLHVGTSTNRRALGSVRIRAIDDTNDILYFEPNNIRSDLGGFITGDVVTVDGVMQLSRILHHWADVGGTWTTFEDGNPASQTGAAGIPGLGVDYNANYADPPWCLMGSHRAAWTNDYVVFDASRSYATGGNAISTYLWDIDGGILAPGYALTDATIAVRWAVADDYLVRCTVRDDSARAGPDDYGLRFDEHTALRRVIVKDRPGGDSPPYLCQINRISGSYPGGWQASIVALGAASTDEFPDSAIVVILAEDLYDDVEGSVVVPGYPYQGDIVFVGYLKGDTVRLDSQKSAVTFEAADITSLMREVDTFPANFKNDATPAQWHEIDDMRIEDIVRHLARWHSNLRDVADVFVSSTCGLDDGKRVDFLDITEGSLYEQMAGQVATCFYGDVVGSRYSSVHVVKNRNMRSEEERFMTPDPYMALTTQDWMEDLEIGDEKPRERVCQVDFIGFIYDPQGNPVEVLALAPRFQTNYGLVEKQTGILLTGSTIADAQPEANELSGLYRAWKNIRFPIVSTQHANNRVFDPALQTYCSITLAAGDSRRGLVWSAKEFIIRRTEVSHDPDKGVLKVRNEWESSTWGPDGVAGEYPSGKPSAADIAAVTNPESYEFYDSGAFENRTGNGGDVVYFCCEDGHVWRGTGMTGPAGSVVYEDLGQPSGAGDICWFIALDEFDPENKAMVATAVGLYVTNNLSDSPPTWTLTRARNFAGNWGFTQVLSSPLRQDYWLALEEGVNQDAPNNRGWPHRTLNGGHTWALGGNMGQAWNGAYPTMKIELHPYWSSYAYQAHVWDSGADLRLGYREIRDWGLTIGWTGANNTYNARVSSNPHHPNRWHGGYRNIYCHHNAVLYTTNERVPTLGSNFVATDLTDCVGAGADDGVYWCGSNYGTTFKYYWALQMCVADNLSNFWTSPDGTTWTTHAMPAFHRHAVAWRYNCNRVYAAQDGAAAPVAYSRNRGATWTQMTGNWGAVGGDRDVYCVAPLF